MTQNKIKYAVYAKRHTDERFSFMGSTFAVNKEKAIRNIQYRLGLIGRGGKYSSFDNAWFYAQ